VLKGLDFEVKRGEILSSSWARSGSAKAFLLKHIIGLEEPDAGTSSSTAKSIRSPDS